MGSTIRRIAAFGLAAAAFGSLALVNAVPAEAAGPKLYGVYPTLGRCEGEGKFREGQLEVRPGWACLFNNPVPGGWNLVGYPR
ncbi:hypothetical protein JOF53_008368 [Crossiella equi]|uniref:Uncharacterized protein n=1 Tax=Crossiella equi TaxID=130796 RepID=A0ABS5ASU2_9PSEU|nr:hypothetical protein [Crossiella equi]MBP2479496.1 hypothetical protein [Crossiella equi]